MTVTGATTNNGMIAADGQPNGGSGGGGAGGSIYLTTATLVGSGTYSADGATTTTGYAGGGGGGRVAIVLTNSASFGAIAVHAYGGAGTVNGSPSEGNGGAAGTVYLKTAGQAYGTVIIDNNSKMATIPYTTRIAAAVTGATVGDVILRNTAQLSIDNSQSMTCYGSWSNGASLVCDTDSTVYLAGTNTATVYGSNAFHNLTCTNAGKTLRFEAGEKTVIQSFGKLTLEGENGNYLVVTSATASAWHLTLQPNALQSVSCVAAAYSDASGGQTIVAPTATNMGNNVNWNFAGGVLKTWTGNANTSWAVADNWSPAAVPISLDTVMIPDVGAGNYPSLVANVEIAGLINAPGTSLTLDGNNLTVTGNADIDGTITASGTEIVTFGGNVDFSNGTFNQATAVVVIAGSAAQMFTPDNNSFNEIRVDSTNGVTFGSVFSADTLRITNTSVSATFSTGFTVVDLDCDGPSAALIFADGASYNVTNLVLRGGAGELIVLRSSGGAAWDLNVSCWQAVRYVDVQDSDASGGMTIYAVNSTNSGDNVNWNFTDWKVWDGSLSTDYATADNWTPVGAPTSADYVLVDGGYGANAPALSLATNVARLTVGISETSVLSLNALLTVTEDVLIGPAGVLNHGDNADAETYKLSLTVGSNLTVAAGGAIDVTGLGYDKGQGPAPGGANFGAGHGGQGGFYNHGPVSTALYGSPTAPTRLGSGGSAAVAGGATASGGGAVMLTVGGRVTLNGEIVANGDLNAIIINGAYDGGGGAGGSVYLTCASMSGSGSILADSRSPNINYSGGGGGGRIAVVLASGTSFDSVTIHAYGSLGGSGGSSGAAGTVYLKQSGLPGELIVDNANRTTGYTTHIMPLSGAAPGELEDVTVIVTNKATVTLSTNTWIDDILIYTNCTLTLTNFYLHVDSMEHSLENLTYKHPDASTNRVDHYDQILWEGSPSGIVIMIR